MFVDPIYKAIVFFNTFMVLDQNEPFKESEFLLFRVSVIINFVFS